MAYSIVKEKINMLSIDELNLNNNRVFENGISDHKGGRLSLIEDKFNAACENNLYALAARFALEYREEQANILGLQKINRAECYTLLTGKQYHFHYEYRFKRYNVEYFYNHDDNSISYDYTYNVEDYWRYGFSDVIRQGTLSALKVDIPYGVLLRLTELKKLKIFNSFSVFAPKRCFNKANLSIDPIITGNIETINSKGISSQISHYFVAQWQ